MGKWEQIEFKESASDTTFTSYMVDKDFEYMNQVCKNVKLFFNSHNAKQNKLLHIGVGVSNPDFTLSGNPSILMVKLQEQVMNRQLEPGFIFDALSNDFVVAKILFNSGITDSKHKQEIQTIEKERFIEMRIPGRFPIKDDNDYCRRSVVLIKEMKEMVNYFSIMNSISQLDYPNITAIASHNSKKIRSSYIKSYAETMSEIVYCIMLPSKKIVFSYLTDNTETKFETMGSVFMS